MKEYTTKSTAQRAAAKEFGVKNNAAAVAEVATVKEFMPGVWIYEGVGDHGTADEIVETASKIGFPVAPVKKTPPVKKAPPAKKKDSGKQTWNRPGEGTVTGRVWELADKLVTRAKVMEAGLAEGIAPGTISQQYHRWNHQK